MEKDLGIVAYWLGIVCTVIALITRGLAMLGFWATTLSGVTSSGRVVLSYKSFLDAALLFFVMAIASAVAMWAKTQKS